MPKLSQESQKIFDEYVPAVFSTSGQKKLFKMFLESLDVRSEMIEEIRVEGYLIEKPSGIKIANPLITELRSLEKHLIRISSQLSLGNNFEHIFNVGSMAWRTHAMGL